jgi:hypothetical protein
MSSGHALCGVCRFRFWVRRQRPINLYFDHDPNTGVPNCVAFGAVAHRPSNLRMWAISFANIAGGAVAM